MNLIQKLFAGAVISAACGCSPKIEPGVSDPYEITQKVVRPTDSNKRSVVFLVDLSGSMDNLLGSKLKIDSAKESLKDILRIYGEYNKSDNNIEAGLISFNSTRIDTLVPLSPFDYEKLASKIDSLKAKGDTPIGMALARAERELDRAANGQKYIVLLSDGENTRGRGPNEVWKNITDYNLRVSDHPTSLHIVAFNTDKKYFDGLVKLGAKTYEAKNGGELTAILRENAYEILEMPMEGTLEEALKGKK